MSTYRDIDIDDLIRGKSSYELAKEHGTFHGTEEEYVNKEQSVFNEMTEYCDKVKDDLKSLADMPNIINNRFNDIGHIENITVIDAMYNYCLNNPTIHFDSNNSLKYACNHGFNMYIGYEFETSGIQMRMSIVSGVAVRYKKDGEWSNWKSFVTADEEVE